MKRRKFYTGKLHGRGVFFESRAETYAGLARAGRPRETAGPRGLVACLILRSR